MMNEVELRKLFLPLYADLELNKFSDVKPLLAHYTSIEVLEKILEHKQVWLSNPLFMNDIEEVRFGMHFGTDLFVSSQRLETACKTTERFNRLRGTFWGWSSRFQVEHLLDTYVLCFSEHSTTDNDGLLSMWRGYGANGHGAAIVFDTRKVVPRSNAPLIIAKVDYKTKDDRINWIQKLIDQFAEIIEQNTIGDDDLVNCSYYFFERLKLFAIFSKHLGFKEENEWRIAYFKDKDTDGAFSSMFSYHIGARGIEPKLKMKLDEIADLANNKIATVDLIDRIILGPSLSAPFVRETVWRMLDRFAMPELKQRTIASSIPFRAARV